MGSVRCNSNSWLVVFLTSSQGGFGCLSRTWFLCRGWRRRVTALVDRMRFTSTSWLVILFNSTCRGPSSFSVRGWV